MLLNQWRFAIRNARANTPILDTVCYLLLKATHPKFKLVYYVYMMIIFSICNCSYILSITDMDIELLLKNTISFTDCPTLILDYYRVGVKQFKPMSFSSL